MSDHIAKAFDDDLLFLRNETSRMGDMAVSQLRDAVRSVVSSDPALAERVIEGDARLDSAEAEIEASAIRLIALRQPVSVDLRNIISAMKIAGNLERCGDLSKNIAKRALVMSGAKMRSPATGSVDRMGQLVAARLEQVVHASREQDIEAAAQVWRRDEEIDQQYDALFRELLTFMMGDPATITSSTHLLFIAKNLERIGDHATNIAELVHYQVTGDPMPGVVRPKWDSLQ
jgi:phosphate transport system protein